MSAEIDITIPEFLLVKNRRPLSKKRRAAVDAWLARGVAPRGERTDYRKPKGTSWEEWDAIQAQITQLVEERKQTALAKLRVRTEALPKAPKIPGYAGHQAGSRLEKLHRCYDNDGFAAAVVYGRELGLNETTTKIQTKKWGAVWPKGKGTKKKKTPVGYRSKARRGD